ncbi:MAG: PAS domain-containing sensor histidine kinase [Nitrospinaceae bacterium]|nr:MAG: PAS domain-containing sensor histidine kinase [Nitrospinaceae bacterium]
MAAPPEKSPGLLQNIFSSLIDGILLVSQDLTIQKGNPVIEEMFRQSKDSFEGQPLSQLFPDQPEMQNKIQQVLTTGASYRDVECRGFQKNRPAFFPVNLTLSPFLDEKGQVQGVLLLVKDMSLLKELEQFSRNLDHLTNIESLALGMAHEIRNPLGGIRASAQLLRQELENPEQQEYLDVVISEVDRINRLIERMMDFTRPRELNKNEINIHKVLNDIILLERESVGQKRIRLEEVYDPSLPLIDADEDQLKQVFFNLIRNAVEASSEKGKIQLITRVSTGYAIKPSPDATPGQSIVVEIIDSGTGINETAMKNLFTPLFTTKNKGSGLGLPISLKIVENHGGKIKITTEEGLGTTVQVFLPVRQR